MCTDLALMMVWVGTFTDLGCSNVVGVGVDDFGAWRTADEMKLEESIEAKPIFQLVFN